MSDIMTDQEVADMLHINVDTLQRKMRTGFAADELDLRKAKPWKLGGRRWWYRETLIGLIANGSRS